MRREWVLHRIGPVGKGGIKMFDKRKFKALLILSEKTIKEVAELLNINEVTLYRKMNGTSDFYRSEIQTLCDHLNIENPAEIFFAKKERG
jgi:hypothetical protein